MARKVESFPHGHCARRGSLSALMPTSLTSYASLPVFKTAHMTTLWPGWVFLFLYIHARMRSAGALMLLFFPEAGEGFYSSRCDAFPRSSLAKPTVRSRANVQVLCFWLAKVAVIVRQCADFTLEGSTAAARMKTSVIQSNRQTKPPPE